MKFTPILRLNIFGKDIELDKSINIEDKNYVSIRELFEKLNCNVDWDGEKIVIKLE